MCRRIVCSKCKKATWSGCGAHVAQIMQGVPEPERCRCDEARKNPANADSGSSQKPGWWPF